MTALLPLIVSIIFFLIYRKKNKFLFSFVSYIYIIYIGMLVACLVLELAGVVVPVKNYSIAAISYFCFAYGLIFYGNLNFADYKINRIIINNINYYLLIEIGLIFLGLASLIFFSPVAATKFLGDIAENRIDISAGNNQLAAYGLINSILSFASNMFIFSLLFFFLRLAMDGTRRNRIYALLNLFSSFSFIVYVFAYAGRDGIVLWLFSFFMVFFLVRKYLPPQEKLKIRNIIIGVILLLMIPFFIISSARFSGREGGLMVQIIAYFGQQIVNFNDIFQVDIPEINIAGVFPLLMDLVAVFGLKDVYYVDNFNDHFLTEGVKPWVFSTFVGSFVQNLGGILAIFIIMFLVFLMRYINNKISNAGRIKMSHLFLLIILNQNILWGVFYFRMAPLNYYIIFVLLLSVPFNFKGKGSLAFKSIN